MLSLNKTLDIAISIRTATARLTDTILDKNEHDLTQTLRTIASEIGLTNIAYMRMSPDKRGDACDNEGDQEHNHDRPALGLGNRSFTHDLGPFARG